MNLRHLNRILFVLSLWIPPLLVFAQPGDQKEPIYLEADRAQLNQQTGISVYQGNVVITQGSLRLAADTVTITMNEGAFEHLKAVGNPASFRYKPAEDKQEIRGASQNIEYNVPADLMVMTTNARVTRARDVFTGDRIEYDLGKDLVKAQSAGRERVQITIQPKSINSNNSNQ